MIRTLGVDHGTMGLRFCFLDGQNKRFYEIDRDKASKMSVLDSLVAKGFLDVDLIGLTYSMADSINSITSIVKVKKRGQIKAVTGELIGGGTQFFDEVVASGKRAVLIPGLHRGISCLDERFKLLYSHMAASEKVALSYHAFGEVNKTIEASNMVISDISSNTVTIGIKDSRFFGAIDAALGAPGLLHGPLDLESIRQIDAGEITANKAFYSAGVSGKTGIKPVAVFNAKGKREKLAMNSLVMSVKMEIAGMVSEVKPQAIALAGSAGIHKSVFHRLKKEFDGIAPVVKLDNFSAAVGAAEVARDILRGKKDFLGIGINI